MESSGMDSLERAAIARLRRGDIDGLEFLVRRYYEVALRAAFLISRDSATAEDVTQTAFLRAYERIGQFDSARPFRPWLMRIVVNDALMTVTRRRQSSLNGEAEQALDLLPSPELDPAALLAGAETKEAVRAALEHLTPGQRAVIVARYYLGLTDTETANRLAVPTGTVRRRLHTARGRLRHLLPAWVR